MPESAITGRYPWYDVVTGRELQQGDLLLDCPLLEMPLAVVDSQDPVAVSVSWQTAIVLTQSCDLAPRDDGKANADHVALCPVYSREELNNDPVYGKPQNWDDARRGRHFGYHVLNRCDLLGQEFDYSLVDLGSLFSLPTGLVRDLAERQGQRIRLNPPYREHLAQAFARFFMRVGLPVDIPKFAR